MAQLHQSKPATREDATVESTDTINRTGTSQNVDENANASDVGDFFVLTPSAHSKAEDERMNGNMSHSQRSIEIDEASLISLELETLPNGNGPGKKSRAVEIGHTADPEVLAETVTIGSARPTTTSRPAKSAEPTLNLNIMGMLITFNQAVHPDFASVASGVINDYLGGLIKPQAGGVRVLCIPREGHLTVNVPSAKEVPAADGGLSKGLFATTYPDPFKGKSTKADAQQKQPAVASLAFLRSELVRARTLCTLTSSKCIVDSAHGSKAGPFPNPVVPVLADDETPSLSALIDMAKKKIHRELCPLEPIDWVNSFADLSLPLLPEKKTPKKTTKKSGLKTALKKRVTSKSRAELVYKAIAIVQLFVLIFLVLCIAGMSAGSKGRCVGLWLGA